VLHFVGVVLCNEDNTELNLWEKGYVVAADHIKLWALF
jgi:hypothetical protein